MIRSIRIDGIELEEVTCEFIAIAMLEYKKDIAEGKDVQATFKEDKEREAILY